MDVDQAALLIAAMRWRNGEHETAVALANHHDLAGCRAQLLLAIDLLSRHMQDE